MLIVNVPIEDYEFRYSRQWNEWFPATWRASGVRWISTADRSPYVGRGLHPAHFLDPLKTQATKAFQSWRFFQMLNVELAAGDEVVVFFHDLWHPLVHQLIYLRKLTGMPIRIAGILHAGAYDRNDLLSKNDAHGWASYFELSIIPHMDLIIVGTNYHRALLHDKVLRKFHVRDPMVVLPLPVDPGDDFTTDLDQLASRKRDLIVFPHRPAQEKNVDLVGTAIRPLLGKFPSYRYYVTADVTRTKAEYYDLLKQAKIAVSMADQETFGIAMIEAQLRGCICVVPDRLAYVDIFPEKFRYSDDEEFPNAMDEILCYESTHGYWKLAESLGLPSVMTQMYEKVNPSRATAEIVSAVITRFRK